MIACAKVALMCVASALAPSFLSHVVSDPSCDGCAADAGVRIATWKIDGPGGYRWVDVLGGQINFTAGTATKQGGTCQVSGTGCSNEGCHAKLTVVINNIGGLRKAVSGSSGCVTFDNLTDAQKTLTAETFACDGAEDQKQFFAYSVDDCVVGVPIPAHGLGSERLIVWAECAICVYHPSEN